MSNKKYADDSWLFRLWFVGPFLKIGSDYVSDGDIRYQKKMAPLGDWWITLFPSIAISFFLLVFMVLLDNYLCGGFLNKTKPAEYFLGVMASFLGFGIGVYALVFGVSSDILRSMQKSHIEVNKSVGGGSTVLSLNSEFAFPLMILLLTCFVLIFQFIFQIVTILNWGLGSLYFFLCS